MNLPDIYFEKDYAQLTSLVEKGEVCEYVYSDDNGTVRNIFIKRTIDIEVSGNRYFDIITPYGYGGPLIIESYGDKESLVTNFYKAFFEYCKQEKIVSGFFRFHPIQNNALDFKGTFNVEKIRKTVATCLSDQDVFLKEFSKSTRKLIRKLLSDEKYTYKIYNNPVNLENFKEIYKNTMDRNQAKAFYYFDDEYFDELKKIFREETYVIDVFYDGICIASGLYFVYGDYLHAHLSGTLNEYLSKSPAYYLKFLTLRLGLDKGCKYIHYGGGTTNSEDDSLFRFKKKFTKNGFFDYYVAKEVFIPNVYEEMVKITSNTETDMFPKYMGSF